MPTTYERAGDEINAVLKQMMRNYHSDLLDAGVTIDVLLAENEDGDAVKLNGYACAAKVKIVGLKDRAKGQADAEIIIDGDRWRKATDATNNALLDHELEHLELKLDKGGKVDRDDLSRPKLRCRKHDYQMGWFNSIAHRHGESSYEVIQARRIYGDAGQLYFAFVEPAKPARSGRGHGDAPTMAIAQ